jgi:hypothetical protein
MASVEDRLGRIKTFSSLLARLPEGDNGRALAAALGAWTATAHTGGGDFTYPTNFSDLSDDALSDAYARWVSQTGRITEVVGLLEGQKILATLRIRQARASCRIRHRRDRDSDGKPVKHTASALSDLTEEDPVVLEAVGLTIASEVALASAKAYKEAATGVITAISREISFRQAQYSARLRA